MILYKSFNTLCSEPYNRHKYKIQQMCVSPTFYCMKREKSVDTSYSRLLYSKYKAFTEGRYQAIRKPNAQAG